MVDWPPAQRGVALFCGLQDCVHMGSMPPPCAKGTLWFTPSPLQRVFSSWGDYWGVALSMSVKTQQPHLGPMGLWVAKTLSVHGMHGFKVTLAHRLFTSVTFVAATTPMAAIDNGHGCTAKATMHAWHA